MYGRDLAKIHHEGFGEFAHGAARGLLQELRRARIRTGTVVDLGCGSGIWLSHLARAGYQTVGIDQSAPLVQIARAMAPTARLAVGSIYRAPIPPCVAVTALGEVLSYLPAEPLPAFFGRVAHALAPGGLFIFDLMVTTPNPVNYRSWRADADWAVLVEVSHQVPQRRITRKITTFQRSGRSFRRGDEVHRLRLVDRATVVRDLRAAGFSVRVAKRYGGQPLAPGRLAFFARRTSSR